MNTKDPKKGAIAFCGLHSIGLILSDTPVEVTYPEGTKAMAWTGIHLTDKIAPIGSPWSSRNPVVIAENIMCFMWNTNFFTENQPGGGNNKSNCCSSDCICKE